MSLIFCWICWRLRWWFDLHCSLCFCSGCRRGRAHRFSKAIACSQYLAAHTRSECLNNYNQFQYHSRLCADMGSLVLYQKAVAQSRPSPRQSSTDHDSAHQPASAPPCPCAKIASQGRFEERSSYGGQTATSQFFDSTWISPDKKSYFWWFGYPTWANALSWTLRCECIRCLRGNNHRKSAYIGLCEPHTVASAHQILRPLAEYWLSFLSSTPRRAQFWWRASFLVGSRIRSISKWLIVCECIRRLSGWSRVEFGRASRVSLHLWSYEQ